MSTFLMSQEDISEEGPKRFRTLLELDGLGTQIHCCRQIRKHNKSKLLPETIDCLAQHCTNKEHSQNAIILCSVLGIDP